MFFRKAKTSEAGTILALYQSVIGTPFCTWNEYYPGEEEIADDLAHESLFVLEEEGEIIGAISIVPENEMDDLTCWTIRENAREFARVVIRPDQQQKGLSSRLIDGIFKELQQQGCAAVHIAVAKENTPAQRLYRKAGFSFCGETDMYGHSYFLCEKGL